ncbi:MAG: diguanylate cyclase [Gallionella sp.]|nr:diguanylate cyclase [Gallionella sp.]
MKSDSPGLSNLLRKYGLVLAGWSLLVAVSLAWNLHHEGRNTLNSASAAARASVSKDIIFRKWVASHGGVYVVPSERTPPNPYLNLPDRDVVTSTGKPLTLMNPAYALREMQANFSDEYGTQSHITSLKPLNPKNAADAWEAGALARFERGSKEFLEVQQMGGQPYMRLMQPFVVESDCLKCHAQQGYKLGDIRGGISTSVPLKAYLAHERERGAELALSHGAIWLIGLAGLGFSYRRERRMDIEGEKLVNALRESEKRFRTIADAAPIMIWMSGTDKLCNFFNKGWLEFTGRSMEQEGGDGWSDGVHPDDLKGCIDAYVGAFDARREFHVEYRLRRYDGEYRWIADHGVPRFGGTGAFLGYIGNCVDITDSKEVEKGLRLSEARYKRITEELTDYQYTVRVENGYAVETTQSSDCVTVTGYTAEEFAASPYLWIQMVVPEDRERVREHVRQVLMGKDVPPIEHHIIRKDGKIRWVSDTIILFKDASGKLLSYDGVIKDITDRKKVEEQIRNMAFYDSLTQLPNRRMLNDRLGQAMAASKRTGLYGALMFLDLDNFKPLNDTYGHEIGDLLLIEVAHRLTGCVREMDTVARFGGDEFVVMFSELDTDKTESVAQASIVAEKIRATLAEPYRLARKQAGKTEVTIEHHCTSSIGVVLFIDHEASPEDIIKWADMAMYQAKDGGRNRYHFYKRG